MAASSSTDDGSLSESSNEHVDNSEQEEFKGDSIIKGQSKGSVISVSKEKDADTSNSSILNSTTDTSILNSASEETEENSSVLSPKLKKSGKFSGKTATKHISEDSDSEEEVASRKKNSSKKETSKGLRNLKKKAVGHEKDSTKAEKKENQDTSENLNSNSSDDVPLMRYANRTTPTKENAISKRKRDSSSSSDSDSDSKSKRVKREPSKKKLNFGNISIELNKPLDSSEVESDDDEANSSSSEKASPKKVKKEESPITEKKQVQSEDNVKGKGKKSSKKPEDDSGIVRLKKYLREAGIQVKNYKTLWEGCNSIKSKKAKLMALLEENGLKGNPTIEKCRKLRKKLERAREVAELDTSNIINTSGRPRRGASSAAFPSTNEVTDSVSCDDQSERKKTSSRLIYSDEESD